MGVSAPTPPGDDPHAGASWADPSVPVLLEQARRAAAGGDLPRARSLLEDVLRRDSLDERDAVEAWELMLETAVLGGDTGAAEVAVDALSSRLAIGEARQRIRMLWVRHRGDADWENALLDRAERVAAGTVAGPGGREAYLPSVREASGDEDLVPASSVHRLLDVLSEGDEQPSPESSVRRLLDLVREVDDEDPGAPDPASAALFYAGGGLYDPVELRSPVEADRLRVLMADEGESGDALPLLEGTELAERTPAEIHRLVADHPGVSGRDLLRRYAAEQARRITSDELRHSYDLGVEWFGQEEYDVAAHVLIPVATVENPDRIGALELLVRALFELGRLQEAEAYLKEAVPTTRRLSDSAYAPLFYWLGKISEERDDPGGAIDYYATARRLDPDLVEAKRRLQVLLQL